MDSFEVTLQKRHDDQDGCILNQAFIFTFIIFFWEFEFLILAFAFSKHELMVDTYVFLKNFAFSGQTLKTKKAQFLAFFLKGYFSIYSFL